MKKFKMLLAVLLSGVLALGLFAGCSSDSDEEPIDDTKTQLYVYNYDGGVGSKWLEDVKADFEAAYAEKSFTAGKKGVQVRIERSKASNITLTNSVYNVIFTQGQRIFSNISQGLYLKITDIVKESLSNVTGGKETGNIESRLSDGYKDMLTAIDGEYYCLPHYETYDGIFYDKDVFEQYGLYIKEGGGFCDADAFDNGVYTGSGKLSVGPDGVRGTSDDGLPSSYEEFFALIDQMVIERVVPFIWTGQYISAYQDRLLNGVWAAYAGKDQMYQNFNFDSNATGKNVKCDVVSSFDGSGNPVIEQTDVSLETGWKTSAQVGKYYALKFLEKIVSNSSYYSNKITGVLSHLDAQEEYINSNLEGKPIGMLIEGSYWYNEAETALKQSENTYKNAAKNRRFAMMELPRQTTGQVIEGHGTKNTLFDALQAYGFINANVKGDAEKEAVSKAFLQFCYTEEQLCKFTATTGTFWGLNYDVSDSMLSGLDNYKKSMVELRSKSDVVSPIASNKIYMNKQTDFMLEQGTTVMRSKVNGTDYSNPFEVLKNKTLTAEEYFLGTIKDQLYWNNNYRDYFN